MKIYHYNLQTGEYTYEGLADKDPLIPGNFLIPRGATKVSPPIKQDDKAVVFINGGWKIIPDYRGKTYYSKETKQEVTFKLGEEPDDTMTTEKPEDMEAEFENGKWVIPEKVKAQRIREQRDGLINNFAWRYERYARNERLNLVQLDNLYEMDSYIQALADLPGQEGFPDSVIFPEYKGGAHAG